MKKRLTGPSLALLLILLVSTACGTPTEPPVTAPPVEEEEATEAPTPVTEAEPAAAEQAEVETLVFAYDTSSLITMDPGRVFESEGFFFIHQAYETLVGYEGDNWAEIVGQAAESWTISPDGLEYTFKLQEGNVFASGNPVTAEDVRWSFERIRNLKGNPAYYMDPVKEVVVVDQLTVKLVLNEPNAAMLVILTGGVFSIVDSKLAVEHGAIAEPGADAADTAEDWLNQNSAGSGPYILTSWVKNTEVTLEANPKYRLPQPDVQKVIVKHVTDPATQRLMLERGDVDVALNLGPDIVEAIKDMPGIQIIPGQTYDQLYVAMTNNPDLNPIVADPRVRKALRYSVDYGELIDLVNGMGIQQASQLPAGVLGSEMEWVEANRPYEDLDMAKGLLEEAGYPDGFDIKMRTFTGVSPHGISYELVAQKLQQDWARIGVNVQLELVEPSVLWTSYREKNDSFILVYTGVDYLDPYDWDFEWVGGHAARLYWEPADVDRMNELRAASIATTDPQERAAAYHELQKILIEEGPYISLLQPQINIALQDNITGYIYAPIYVTDIYLIDKE
jgi:peptide/nickel transport system substrate-binding protein